MKRLAVGLLAVVLLSSAPVAGAVERPVYGIHAQGDWATASFQQLPTEGACFAVYPWVAFYAGDRAAELGSGRPWSWSDVSVGLTIYDTCAEGALRYDLYGWVPVPPTMASLDIAIVDDAVVYLEDRDGNRINAVVDLAWVGGSDPRIQPVNDPDHGRHGMERVVNAGLSGTLTFSGGNLTWPGMRAFTPADAISVEMGKFHWNQVLRW
ncbi:MAG TPA: hypothetical protein VLS28_03615 [Candidatus Sulfomarinibacteraceae bacterium]|nr:hypothetical protein [Candidatus Sulfomarinibacteraceae bacterium]